MQDLADFARDAEAVVVGVIESGERRGDAAGKSRREISRDGM